MESKISLIWDADVNWFEVSALQASSGDIAVFGLVIAFAVIGCNGGRFRLIVSDLLWDCWKKDRDYKLIRMID